MATCVQTEVITGCWEGLSSFTSSRYTSWVTSSLILPQDKRNSITKWGLLCLSSVVKQDLTKHLPFSRKQSQPFKEWRRKNKSSFLTTEWWNEVLHLLPKDLRDQRLFCNFHSVTNTVHAFFSQKTVAFLFVSAWVWGSEHSQMRAQDRKGWV